jgi:autotransporter-associated beta strand protein
MASAAETAGLTPGMYVQGVGIPQNTVIGTVSGTPSRLVNASTGAAVNATVSHASNNLIFGAPIANYLANVSTTGTFTDRRIHCGHGWQHYRTGGRHACLRSNIPNGATIASHLRVVRLHPFCRCAAGTGSLTFTAPLPYFSNTYTGDTVVNQGTLNIRQCGFPARWHPGPG